MWWTKWINHLNFFLEFYWIYWFYFYFRKRILINFIIFGKNEFQRRENIFFLFFWVSIKYLRDIILPWKMKRIGFDSRTITSETCPPFVRFPLSTKSFALSKYRLMIFNNKTWLYRKFLLSKGNNTIMTRHIQLQLINYVFPVGSYVSF